MRLQHFLDQVPHAVNWLTEMLEFEVGYPHNSLVELHSAHIFLWKDSNQLLVHVLRDLEEDAVNLLSILLVLYHLWKMRAEVTKIKPSYYREVGSGRKEDEDSLKELKLCFEEVDHFVDLILLFYHVWHLPVLYLVQEAINHLGVTFGLPVLEDTLLFAEVPFALAQFADLMKHFVTTQMSRG